jgi:hypothetical protein
MTANILQGKKRTWVFLVLGLTLLLAGSVFGVDWANYFLGTAALYPAIGKPLITLLAMLLVLSIGGDRLGGRDWWLLFAAFACMLPTDILMSVVVVSPSLSVGSSVFMLGGVLSIVAHIFLIARLAAHGAPAWKRGGSLFSKLWLPLVIYASAAAILIVLWPDVVRVGHAAIAPAYTAFFCTTMWFAWETVRRGLLPKPNAWMAALAATCWFATEITGEVYNLGLGTVSEITFRLVWVFYGANVVLWALSGFRWQKEPA